MSKIKSNRTKMYKEVCFRIRATTKMGIYFSKMATIIKVSPIKKEVYSKMPSITWEQKHKQIPR